MKPNTIDKSQFEEAKAQYADTVERKKTYIRNNSVYIENKRKRIGLNESESLGDLCFSLEMKDGCNILMFEDVVDQMVRPPAMKDQFRETGELLVKLMGNTSLTDRLNIDYNLLTKITKEHIDEMEASSAPIERPFIRITDNMYVGKCTRKLFIEMSGQASPKIRAKDQIKFVISLYSRYKYIGYNYKGDDERIPASHYNAVEQMRIRALQSISQ